MADPVIIAGSFDVEVDNDGMIDDSVVRSTLEDFLHQLDLEDDGAQQAAERLDALEALLYASSCPAAAHQARAARETRVRRRPHRVEDDVGRAGRSWVVAASSLCLDLSPPDFYIWLKREETGLACDL